MRPRSNHKPLTEPSDFTIDSDDDVTYNNSPASTSHTGDLPFKDSEFTEPDDEPPYSTTRRLSFIDQDAAPAQPEILVKAKEEPVTWMSLPHKRQLTVLTLARLSEPLVQTSLQSYMFFQLKSFDPSLPDSTIAAQAGVMQASFTGAQFLTAMIWGRVSDADWGGRKTVLMIGLLGTRMIFQYNLTASEDILTKISGFLHWFWIFPLLCICHHL